MKNMIAVFLLIFVTVFVTVSIGGCSATTKDGKITSSADGVMLVTKWITSSDPDKRLYFGSITDLKHFDPKGCHEVPVFTERKGIHDYGSGKIEIYHLPSGVQPKNMGEMVFPQNIGELLNWDKILILFPIREDLILDLKWNNISEKYYSIHIKNGKNFPGKAFCCLRVPQGASNISLKVIWKEKGEFMSIKNMEISSIKEMKI